jgi:adenylate cyclase
MPVEIERKFLVANDAWRRQADAGILIRQGYLTNAQQLSLRVRISGDGKAKLTIKFPRTEVSRLEYEYDIPMNEAEELMELGQGAIVAKRRHHIAMGDVVWQVDVFEAENCGLVMAEIELNSEDQEFDRPGWVGDEVTQHRRYQNSQLAHRPYRSWEPQPAEASHAAG